LLFLYIYFYIFIFPHRSSDPSYATCACKHGVNLHGNLSQVLAEDFSSAMGLAQQLAMGVRRIRACKDAPGAAPQTEEARRAAQEDVREKRARLLRLLRESAVRGAAAGGGVLSEGGCRVF
jgi:hypothetical protein